jgi:hypothetical protein
VAVASVDEVRPPWEVWAANPFDHRSVQSEESGAELPGGGARLGGEGWTGRAAASKQTALKASPMIRNPLEKELVVPVFLQRQRFGASQTAQEPLRNSQEREDGRAESRGAGAEGRTSNKIQRRSSQGKDNKVANEQQTSARWVPRNPPTAVENILSVMKVTLDVFHCPFGFIFTLGAAVAG